jgi:ABC-type dipeptide/oligopeptide/nickel transport system permease subunit
MIRWLRTYWWVILWPPIILVLPLLRAASLGDRQGADE